MKETRNRNSNAGKLFPRLIVFSTICILSLVSGVTAQDATPKPDEFKIQAVLFHQKAAEYRALCYQAFNIARIRFDSDKKYRKKLPKSERRKPRAIIVDADETVMDNSPYFAWLAATGNRLTLGSFKAWNESNTAKPIPGALDFLKYASSKGVKIFYVSNRPANFQQTSVENLKRAGFPDAKDEHVLLISDTSSKEPRRQSVFEKYRVMFLIGDNLNDFSEAFERKGASGRFEAVDAVQKDFGQRFILVPNVMYGAWERAQFENKRVRRSELLQEKIRVMDKFAGPANN